MNLAAKPTSRACADGLLIVTSFAAVSTVTPAPSSNGMSACHSPATDEEKRRKRWVQPQNVRAVEIQKHARHFSAAVIQRTCAICNETLKPHHTPHGLPRAPETVREGNQQYTTHTPTPSHIHHERQSHVVLDSRTSWTRVPLCCRKESHEHASARQPLANKINDHSKISLGCRPQLGTRHNAHTTRC